MSETDEIKEWQTFSALHRISAVLMLDKVPFSYNEESGIVFAAPGFYVEKLIFRMITAHGCTRRPIINEIK